MKNTILTASLFLSVFGWSQNSGPFLLDGVSIGPSQIVLATSGRLWSVSHQGGLASPLTSSPYSDAMPLFSPDSSRLAFYREMGEGDVFLLDLQTGEETRLTWHGSADYPVAWSPAGDELIIASLRSGNDYRLYRIKPGTDPIPLPLPLPSGRTASWAPDGRLTYTPRGPSLFSLDRLNRGGNITPIWNTDLDSGKTQTLVSGKFNAWQPVWKGNDLYYLSDADGIMNLYRRHNGQTQQITRFKSYGARHFSIHGDQTAIARDGFVYLHQHRSNDITKLDIRIPLDMSHRRQYIANAADAIQSVTLIPDSQELCITARGDVFRLHYDSLKAHNLTRTSGVSERSGVISPDGKTLAFFSDQDGGYQLHLLDLKSSQTKIIPIEQNPGFYHDIHWSPNNNHLAFTDNRLGLWIANSQTGKSSLITRSPDSGQASFRTSWSPEGRYLAFEKRNQTRQPAIYIHDIGANQTNPITDGSVYAYSPSFDPSGRYLYFLASPNASRSDVKWSVLSSLTGGPAVVTRLFAVALQKDAPAPIKPSAQPNHSIDWDTTETTIDFDNITQRITLIPMPEATHIAQVHAARPGKLFLTVREWPHAPTLGQRPLDHIYLFNLRNPGKLRKLVEEPQNPFAAGSRLSWRSGDDLVVMEVDASGETQLHRPSWFTLPAPVDTEKEWAQIYREAWRAMKDTFYDPNHHGRPIAADPPGSEATDSLRSAGVEAIDRHFAAWLPNIATRRQLNTLIRRGFSRLSVSHLRVSGGDYVDRPSYPTVGLLGTDFTVENGAWRMTRIMREIPFRNWSGAEGSRDGRLNAPLDQPGSRVEEGEYLFAVDGKTLDPTHNIYSYFEGKSNQPVRLEVGPNPDRSNTRTITVHSLRNDAAIRTANWAEANRKKVDQLSNGQAGYFHIASYSPGQIHEFLRGWYGNMEKKALVIDQRNNPGGITSDELYELVARDPVYYYQYRYGDDIPMPVNPGPLSKVLIINERNGSAAETFALMFKLGKVGGIVGKTTGGGGIGGYNWQPTLIDGGRLTIPNRAAYDPAGNWGIENMGVSPDQDVEIWPQDWQKNKDKQLEAAVKLALQQHQQNPNRKKQKPAFPVYP